MTADERLAGIRAKIERANKHISDLDAACGAFCETQEGQITSRMGPNTGERSYYVQFVRDIPLEIACNAGDAVHSLRSVLDHLAHQLVIVNGNKPTSVTNFPICADASLYAERVVRSTKGMSQKAMDRISEYKPYKGGNDTLWRVHQLDIIDKHRLLFAACLVNASHSMTPSQVAGVNKTLPGRFSLSPGLHIAAPIRSVPLKAGYDLLTVPQSDAGELVKFRFVIAFDEPKLFPRHISIIATLQPMADYVDMVTTNFSHLLV